MSAVCVNPKPGHGIAEPLLSQQSASHVCQTPHVVKINYSVENFRRLSWATVSREVGFSCRLPNDVFEDARRLAGPKLMLMLIGAVVGFLGLLASSKAVLPHLKAALEDSRGAPLHLKAAPVDFASLRGVSSYVKAGPCHVEIPELGTMQGTSSPMMQHFLGIPFGVAARFEPPEPAPPWKPAILDAGAYRPACMHPSGPRAEGVSEDCLYLNVFRPPNAAAHEKRPVLLSLHGGGYTNGAGSDTTPEDVGDLVLEHNVVVVSTNYRLGVFGFLGSDALRSSKDGTTGNFGTQDQALAFNWVRKHISHFGGDPHNVTVIGWSAGAASISVHLTAPSSRGLFQRAIMMSGGFANWAALPMIAAEEVFATVIKCLGCAQGDRACLMAKTAAETMNCGGGQWYGPVVDGSFLPKSPFEAALGGDSAVDYTVPIIIGSALEDKLVDIGRHADVAKLRRVIAAELGHGSSESNQTSTVDLDEALRLYPLQSYADHPEIFHSDWSPAYWAARQMLTDRDFTCVMREVATQWSLKGKAKAFLYNWRQPQLFSAEQIKAMKADSDQNDARPLGGACFPCPGVGHGSDLAFLFKNDQKVNVRIIESGNLLSVRLQSFYGNFAWSSQPHDFAPLEGGAIDPMGPQAPVGALAAFGQQASDSLEATYLPRWHQYNEDNAMEFSAALTHEVEKHRSEVCSFWASHPKRGGLNV